MVTTLPVSSNHISVSLFFFLIPVIILKFTSFRIAFVEGPFLPEKAQFKTGRIHGFSNRNAADDAGAVQRFCKRNSAKICGLDRKTAFPISRRNHGCETELFPEVFVSFAAVPECRFSIPTPEFHRSVASLTPCRRGHRKVISHSDGYSVFNLPLNW